MRPLNGKSVFAGLVIAAVAAVVVGGLLSLDSPQQERRRRLDARRVADLTRMARAVDLYWTRQASLPTSLEELAQTPGLHVDWRDPATVQPYPYRALGDSTYELCAVFARTSAAAGREEKPDFWSHGDGRQCFRLTAKKMDPRKVGNNVEEKIAKR